jgi:hypothetical protein
MHALVPHCSNGKSESVLGQRVIFDQVDALRDSDLCTMAPLQSMLCRVLVFGKPLRGIG